ncbi:hypothetical protein BaRGS_00015433 [Batillaria attramentaria]|uniref:Uncharacterized protein n=1 Tax=Batillaria attramentaria TaxID=370345 RepID=A0ABD0L1M7_9CAEN
MVPYDGNRGQQDGEVIHRIKQELTEACNGRTSIKLRRRAPPFHIAGQTTVQTLRVHHSEDARRAPEKPWSLSVLFIDELPVLLSNTRDLCRLDYRHRRDKAPSERWDTMIGMVSL